jgi:hypothetical protein
MSELAKSVALTAGRGAGRTGITVIVISYEFFSVLKETGKESVSFCCEKIRAVLESHDDHTQPFARCDSSLCAAGDGGG